MNLKKEDIHDLTYDELIHHIRSSWEYDNKAQYSELSQALKDEFAKREPTTNFECPKCKHNQYTEHQIRTAGGAFSAIFNVETEKYRVITCTKCNYSEFYKTNISVGSQVLDWLFG